MKALSDRHAPVNHCLRDRLGDIVRMNVVHCLESEVGQTQFFTASQPLEYLGIKMAGWIQWFPSGSDDMARMQDGGGKSRQASFSQQILFNRRFANAVVAEGLSRRFFGGRDLDTRPMDPDGAA